MVNHSWWLQIILDDLSHKKYIFFKIVFHSSACEFGSRKIKKEYNNSTNHPLFIKVFGLSSKFISKLLTKLATYP